jgi:hypothetical protein
MSDDFQTGGRQTGTPFDSPNPPRFEFCPVCSRIYDKIASSHCPHCGTAAPAQDRLDGDDTDSGSSVTTTQSHPLQLPGAVTAAGLMLVSFGLVGIVAVAYAGMADLNGGVFWGWPAALSVAVAGLAIVRRWRGWRIWTGLFASLAIALSAIVVQMILFDLIHPSSNPNGSTMASPTAAAFALMSAAVGIFMLWATRKEPSDDSGKTVAVTIGGMVLVAFAVFFAAIGIIASVSAQFGTLAFGFVMAGLHGYAALAIFRRWKYWRGAARSAALVTMALFLIYGIARAQENAVEALIGIEAFIAIFGYVLWAVRQTSPTKSALLAELEAPA